MNIHSPTIREVEGITYVNCGDFVESLTLVVETEAGEFKIMDFKDKVEVKE